MKHKGHRIIKLESLVNVKDKMANYIVYYNNIYTFAPKAVSRMSVHIGFGSQNHAETIQSIIGKVNIVEIWVDCRTMKDFGIGKPNSKQDLQ